MNCPYLHPVTAGEAGIQRSLAYARNDCEAGTDGVRRRFNRSFTLDGRMLG